MVKGRRRVPHFERPRPPRDWRWAVGIIGRALIALGLLMFGFVAYQLWGTGIQTAQAQRDLESEFNELLQSTTTVDQSPTTTRTEPTSTSAGPSTSTTTTLLVAPNATYAEGSPIAILRIPTISLEWTVVEGVDPPDLQKGPGHLPETPMPGQLGNAAIAGHRTTYGAPFYDLDDLTAGDRIEIDTLSGRFVYEVSDKLVVGSKEYAKVIPTTDPNAATLTLATCTPIGSARNRLILHARIVPDQSDALTRPPSATTPDDTSTTTPGTLPGETASMVTDESTTTSTGGAPTPVTTPTSPTAGGDAFSQGWFDDTRAVPHTVAWGAALAAVALGAYSIARARKRLWVGFAVGAVPFVIVLYFFFENVNRLLPSGI